MEKIFVINPGSTSTKIALYEGEQELWKESISHPTEELERFSTILEEEPMRYALVLASAEKHGLDMHELSAVAARGGPIARFHSGAYRVTEALVEKARKDPIDQHASILGAVMAWRIFKDYGVPGYIYDAVSVDEMLPVCKVTGLPWVERRGQGHNLNMRSAAIRLCREENLDYFSSTILVAHLGGGITMSLHQNGRIVDIVPDEDGSFSPERAGLLPITQYADICYGGKYGKKEFLRLMKGGGGLRAWFGTNDTRRVEEMAASGDEKAELVYDAMALNVAKNIARLAPVCEGKVDRIVLTGGIAHSQNFVDRIIPRVEFIAPVTVLPGENEMQALSGGVLRVLRGTESCRIYEEETESSHED